MEWYNVWRACPRMLIGSLLGSRWPDDLRRNLRRLRPRACLGTSWMSSTFSWQKAMGGEGAHGVLVSFRRARAIERLETFCTLVAPLPKIFRLTKAGKLIDGVFKRRNDLYTPSMLAVADADVSLRMDWADRAGGSTESLARACGCQLCCHSKSWVDAKRTGLRTWRPTLADAVEYVRLPESHRSRHRRVGRCRAEGRSASRS